MTSSSRIGMAPAGDSGDCSLPKFLPARRQHLNFHAPPALHKIRDLLFLVFLSNTIGIVCKDSRTPHNIGTLTDLAPLAIFFWRHHCSRTTDNLNTNSVTFPSWIIKENKHVEHFNWTFNSINFQNKFHKLNNVVYFYLAQVILYAKYNKNLFSNTVMNTKYSLDVKLIQHTINSIKFNSLRSVIMTASKCLIWDTN